MGNAIDWAALTAPVPEQDIEWVEKAHGRKFAYMSAQFVRRRLDSVLQGRWSYRVTPVKFTEGQPAAGDGEPFVVVGSIVIDETIERDGIGSGKNFKEAETDAFKRAAQRLGIGNELYEMGPGVQSKSSPAPKAAPAVGYTAEDKAVLREAAVSAPAAAPAGDVPACPECQGKMFDNRLDKRNPRAPDFVCRRKKEGCPGVVWPARTAPQPVVAAAAPARPWEEIENDSLPF